MLEIEFDLENLVAATPVDAARLVFENSYIFYTSKNDDFYAKNYSS